MATIEQLLGASADDIEKMSDDELAVYLKDIKNLEPLSSLKPLIEEPIKEKKKKGKKDFDSLLKNLIEDLQPVNKYLQ